MVTQFVTMKLKVPPILIFFAFAVIMYVVAKFLPIGSFNFFGRKYLVIGLLVIASIVVFISLLQFYIKKTTVNPTKIENASNLVTSGIYRYSRNPMYLGMLLVLLALGVWLGNAFNSLIAAGFVSYMNRFQIIPEEEVLLKIFGKAYSQYYTLVRRWF